jgi:hypothetical protein
MLFHTTKKNKNKNYNNMRQEVQEKPINHLKKQKKKKKIRK